MNPKISIIMATYNGEKYLSEQIESILRQTYTDWELIIRDDGSRDGTVRIILEYIKRYPEKIKLITDKIHPQQALYEDCKKPAAKYFITRGIGCALIPGASSEVFPRRDENGNLGVSQNYIYILSHTKTDYVMFCDQDDIWLQDKIDVTFSRMSEIEAKYGVDTPVLIHTDLKVVNENLDILSESFWKYQHLDPRKGKSLNRLLVQNTITGATVMLNKALTDKVKPFQGHGIIYDWWMGLVAATFGKIDYVPSATILYRQHESNTIGAKRWGLPFILKTIKKGQANVKTNLIRTQLQAELFLNIFRDELKEEYLELLTTYSTLEKQSFFAKRLILMRYRLFKIGFIRNIGLFLNI